MRAVVCNYANSAFHASIVIYSSPRRLAMLLKHSATVSLAVFVASSFIQMPFAPAQESPGLPPVAELVAPDVPPPSCHVTLPSEEAPMASSPVRATKIGVGADGTVRAYGTEKLSTFLPT